MESGKCALEAVVTADKGRLRIHVLVGGLVRGGGFWYNGLRKRNVLPI